jgi:hypothetical protein
MMKHEVWNMLGCPFFPFEFAKFVSFVDELCVVLLSLEL